MELSKRSAKLPSFRKDVLTRLAVEVGNAENINVAAVQITGSAGVCLTFKDSGGWHGQRNGDEAEKCGE
jgi:hypothetical protein